jgi:putative transposase
MSSENYTYWVDVFSRICYKIVVVDSLNYCIENKGLTIYTWLLYRFSFAGKFDNRIKNFKVWKDTSHPILLDSNNLIDQKINYIHQNPVRALMVQNAEDYIFSSACDYAAIKGMVKMEIEI